jgi:hypothetical protein
MGFKDIAGSLIKKVAPTIGTALGGPIGGMATKFLADKFLGKPEASEEEIEQAIVGASPEQLLKLKELDRQFQADLKKLDIDIFRLEVEDRKSARELFKVSIWPQIVLSAMFTIGYFWVLIILLKGSAAIAPENQPVANVVVGVLTAAMTTIFAFWFGSSYGSKEKNKSLMGEK